MRNLPSQSKHNHTPNFNQYIRRLTSPNTLGVDHKKHIKQLKGLKRILNDKEYSLDTLLRIGELHLEELLDRITINPRVMAGKPVIRGTRITVDIILELLAMGMKPEEIAEDYKISVEDVRAALLYAAKVLGREEILIASKT